MEPQNGEGESIAPIISNNEADTSVVAPVRKVSAPFKVFAAVLFIALPFLGLYVGYRLAFDPATVAEPMSEVNATSHQVSEKWSTYADPLFGFSIKFPPALSPEISEMTSDYLRVTFVPDAVTVVANRGAIFEERLAYEQSFFEGYEIEDYFCGADGLRGDCFVVKDYPKGPAIVRVVEGNGFIYTIFALTSQMPDTSAFMESFISLPGALGNDSGGGWASEQLPPGVYAEKFAKPSSTIRYVYSNDRSKESPIMFDNYSKYQEIEDVAFLDESARVAAELPYFEVISEIDGAMILSVSCFIATECSNSGLYKLDLVTNSLKTMNTTNYYNLMNTGGAVSFDKTKLLVVSGYDLPNGLLSSYGTKIGYVDLVNDAFVPLKKYDVLEPYRFSSCEMGCTSNFEWVDDDTVQVDVSVYEYCKIEDNDYVICYTNQVDDSGNSYLWGYTKNVQSETIEVP